MAQLNIFKIFAYFYNLLYLFEGDLVIKLLNRYDRCVFVEHVFR